MDRKQRLDRIEDQVRRIAADRERLNAWRKERGEPEREVMVEVPRGFAELRRRLLGK